MGELRWVLLGLGAVVILAIYVWGSGRAQRIFAGLRRPRAAEPPAIRKDPHFDGAEIDSEGDGERPPDEEEAGAETERAEPRVERIVTVRLIPREGKLSSDTVILALRAAGLRHGRYGIFHMLDERYGDEPLFSVASLTEPGSFDLNKLAETKIPGMSFFMVLPGVGEPVVRFDQMVDTARRLARTLDAELRDEKGSSWSVQRERYVREEIIEYRHQMDREAEII